MDPEVIKTIHDIIDEYRVFAIPSGITPYDYVTLKERLLELELQREIELLTKLLKQPDTFLQEFKRQCAFREQDIEYTVSLQNRPNSKTNALYWQLAFCLFKPTNLKQLIAVLLPSVTAILNVDLIPGERLQGGFGAKENFIPVLNVCSELESIMEVPLHLERFGQLVVHKNIIFDLDQIANFPLVIHAHLQRMLRENHSEMAVKIYQHNSDLQTLSADILTLNHRGTTPLAALELLIKGFNLGGSKMNSGIFASKSAENALKQFLTYFNALPLVIQQQLRLLTGNDISLGTVIDVNMEHGHCVETTANELSHIVRDNKSLPLLNTSPNMTPLGLKILKDRYKLSKAKWVLNIQKDANMHLTLPMQLSKQTILTIVPKSHEELILLFLNFPSEFYATLFANFKFPYPETSLTILKNALALGYFNSEQQSALVTAIIKNHSRIITYETALSFAIKTNMRLFVEEALSTIPSDQRIAKLTVNTSNTYKGHSLLRLAIKFPQSLKTILEFLTTEEKQYALPFLHYTLAFPESFHLLWMLIPDNKKLATILQPNAQNRTIIQDSGALPRVLLIILSSLSQIERVQAIKVTTLTGRNCLQQAVGDPDFLRLLLNLLPENDRLPIINKPNFYGNNLLHSAAVYHESLVVLLSLISPAEISSAIAKTDANGKNVFHLAASYPNSLRTILFHLPIEHRLELIQTRDKEGRTILHLMAKFKESFITIFPLIPNAFRLHVIMLTDSAGNTPLHLAADNPECIAPILNFLMPTARLTLIKKTNLCNESVIHSAKHNPKTLYKIFKMCQANLLDIYDLVHEIGDSALDTLIAIKANMLDIISWIPSDKRLEMLIKSDAKGETLLHRIANKEYYVQDVISLLPSTERLPALLRVNISGKSVLEKVTIDSKALKMILCLLPEPQRWSVLKLKFNHVAILDILLVEKIRFTYLEVPGSFMPTFIELCHSLNHRSLSSSNFFRANLSHLREQLNQCQTFEEAKDRIRQFARTKAVKLFNSHLMARLNDPSFDTVEVRSPKL